MMFVTKRSSSPSASKSPDAMPMLPSGLPAAFNAAPESRPSSVNVPSCRLIQS